MFAAATQELSLASALIEGPDRLSWATRSDAAAQAGLSRRYSSIDFLGKATLTPSDWSDGPARMAWKKGRGTVGKA